MKANDKVKFQVGGSPQNGAGTVVQETDAGVLVAVDSLLGEKPKENIRPVFLFPAATLTVLGIILALLALMTVPAQAQVSPASINYQTPLNNITSTGTNVYNLPGLQYYLSNTGSNYSGYGGYQNTNNLPSTGWNSRAFNKTTLELYVYNLNNLTNAQTVSVGLVASLDNVHWFAPSIVGATAPGPNSLSVTVPANTAVSTNATMYSITATNFDSYGQLYWAVSAVTNAVAGAGGAGNLATNQINLVVFGKAGL